MKTFLIILLIIILILAIDLIEDIETRGLKRVFNEIWEGKSEEK